MKLAVFAIFSLLATTGFANELTKKSTYKTGSEGVRERSSFQVGANATPLFMGGIGGAGFEAGYILNSDLTLGLNYMTGERNYYTDFDLDYDTTASAKASQTSIQANYFLGNSFFFSSGLGYRQVAISASAEDSTGKASASLDAASPVVTVGLGNLWTFDSGFYIGADWLRLSTPLGGGKTSASSRSTLDDKEEEEELEDDVEDIAERLNRSTLGTAANLRIGVMF